MVRHMVQSENAICIWILDSVAIGSIRTGQIIGRFSQQLVWRRPLNGDMYEIALLSTGPSISLQFSQFGLGSWISVELRISLLLSQ